MLKRQFFSTGEPFATSQGHLGHHFLKWQRTYGRSAIFDQPQHNKKRRQ